MKPKQGRHSNGRSGLLPNQMLFIHGLGCHFHNNCFDCPLKDSKKCKWSPDKDRVRHDAVSMATYRQLIAPVLAGEGD